MDMQLPQGLEDLADDTPAAPVERRVAARLLEYKRGSFVAFAPHATMGLVERPKVVPVPGAPYYCHGLISWEGRQLPLLDLNALLRAYPGSAPTAIDHVLVLAFQRVPGQPLEYAALCAPLLVQMVQVADSQQCELPDDSDLWPLIAVSCFLHEDRPVPVLDTNRLFAQPDILFAQPLLQAA